MRTLSIKAFGSESWNCDTGNYSSSLICTKFDKNLPSYSAYLKPPFSYYAILATCCSVTVDFILDTHLIK